MSYLGDKLAGETIYFKFTSVNTSGVPTAITTPVLAVYKNNSTSESQAGLTVTAGFDSLTGLNHVTIDTSQDGTFYANGNDFQVIAVTGSVSGNSIVGYVVGEFSLANRSPLRPTTAGRTLDVSAGGEAGIDWANIGSPTTAQNLSGTNIDTDQVVASVTNRVTANVDQLNGAAQSLLDLKDFADDGYDPSTNKVQGVVLVDTLTTYTGNTPQTGDAFARLGAPAGASVSADILVIDNLVDDLESRIGTPSDLGSGATVAANLVDIEAQTDDIGTAGAGLSNIPWNASWDAQVESEVTDALVAYDPPTHAELVSEVNAVQADIAALNNLSSTDVENAVWDATLADHLDSGSTGEALNAAGAAGDPWTTALPGAYGAGSAGNIIGNNLNATVSSRASQSSLDTVDNNVDAILADTGTDGVVVAASSKTGYSLSAAGIQAIWDALTSALTTAGSIGKLLVDNINATISSRSSHSAADVWTVATRLLTAGTNIVLAKGVGVTGFNDLSAAQVNAEVDTALSDVGLTTTITGRIDAAVSTRATPAQVNAEVVDALATDTYAEPGQGAPPATTTLANKMGYVYKAFRNRYTQTSSQFSLYADDGTTIDQKATVSDDGTTFDRGEIGSGP